VVAYNYVANWHDGIDIATYGDPDGTPNELNIPRKTGAPRTPELRDRVPISIDFYNNDIYNMADNCIEADGGAHNIRVFRNRCFNSAGGALSAQPTFGGPLYFYQNLIYDTTTGGPLKLIDTPAGVLIYQNTFVGEGRLMGPASNVHFLNNLILGDGLADPVLNLRTYTNYSSSDYNGFRPNPGVEDAFEWNSPKFDVAADFQGQLVTRHFKSLKECREVTKQEQHSILVDYDIFVNAKTPDKSDPQRLYNPEDFDFRLRPFWGELELEVGAAQSTTRVPNPAIDAGTVLPTINDDFTGRGPDLGAYELDRPVPHYGPRSAPLGVPDSTAPRSVKGPPSSP
jgi:hypothetical protein